MTSITGRLQKANLIIALVLGLAAFSQAQDSQPRFANGNSFGSLLILDNGRAKPVDSYARSMLTQLSGRQTYNGMSAIQWLCRVIFAPFAAADDKVFLVNNPEVVDAIGSPQEKGRRYSFNQIKLGFRQLGELAQRAEAKESKDRSQFENEAVRVFSNLQDYLQLSSTLMFLVPYPEFAVADAKSAAMLELDTNESALSYYDVVPHSQQIAAAAAAAAQKDKAVWTGVDSTAEFLSRALTRWNGSRGDQPFHIIPRFVGGKQTWQCPWLVMLSAGAAAPHVVELSSLAAMRTAFVSGDDKRFAEAVSLFSTVVKSISNMPSPAIELLYNRINPFLKAKIVYGIAAILALLLVTVSSRKWIRTLCLTLIGVALLPHTLGLVSRIIILHRPPLATIYETFLVVAWACAILGLIIESLHGKSLGLLISSLCGFFFLHLAGKYNVGEDSMGMIAAVLNSNFWLTTHIMSVTLGYAGCCCAGIIGHVYLIKKLFLRIPDDKLSSVAGALYGILAFGLVFTVIGTMLGGMWADQSWGRFWGWDPKENGALLIILWSAVVFHARLAGLVKQTGVAVGAILSLVLVMFAWIGVNLLGIGMHSYGFTATGVTVLYSFLIAEAFFLAASTTAFLLGSKKAK
jgi:ABC-type transport system involved in cytochrome c biogenesis permease subunit